jgi:hypothetical protein
MPLERLLRSARALTFWERLAFLAWLIPTVVVAILVFRDPGHHSVYPIFAKAGNDWRAGMDLYNQTGDPFRYSPFAAVVFVPLSFLPSGIAPVVWRLSCIATCLAGLSWWSRATLSSLTNTQRALLFLLTGPLAVGNMYNGQANLLVIGLLLLATAALTRECFNLAAVCLALACLFKVYPLAVALLFLLFYPRRLGPRLILALTAGLLLPFLLQWPDYVASQYTGWLHHLESNDRQLLIRDLWYRDLRLLVTAYVTPMSYQSYQIVEALAGLGIAATCVMAHRLQLPRQRLLNLVLTLGCCWTTVLGPATESATYVLLAPVASWLMLKATTSERSRVARTAWVASYVLLLIAQIASWFPWGRTFHSLGPQPLAGLILLGGVLIQLRLDLQQRKTMPQVAPMPATARAAQGFSLCPE